MSCVSSEFAAPVIAAILGAAGGAWLTYLFAVRLADRQFQYLREISKLDAFRIAAKEFRAAFAEEKSTLESTAELSLDLDKYLLVAYKAKHRLAIAAFEDFLPATERRDFKAACQQYHSGHRFEGLSEEEALFFEYQPGHPPTQKLMGRQLAALRIRELLAFARHE